MIHRIRIQNYKSIRDVTVELSPVTVLIGRSGTGKTNFCEAIRLLRDEFRVSEENRSKRHLEARPLGRTDHGIAYEIEFSIDRPEYRYLYQVAFGPSAGLKSESLRYESEIVFSQGNDVSTQNRSWIVRPPAGGLPALGKIAIGQMPMVDPATMAYRYLRDGLGVYSFPYDVLEKPNCTVDGRFSDDGGNILGVLRAIWTNQEGHNGRKNLEVILKQINPAIVAMEIDSIDQPKSLVLRHRYHDRDLVIPVQDESSGFRRFLAHLLALYQSPPRRVQIFEEPENGIFPGALAVLSEEFQATPEEGRGQVILTTHNPVLLNHFDADQIRVVEMDENFETQIGPLALEQRAALKEKLLYPGELFTVDVARRGHEVVTP